MGKPRKRKRRRRKSARAGCAMCKPWKQNGIKGTAQARTRQERRGADREREQRRQV